jgi:uncharacterized protein
MIAREAGLEPLADKLFADPRSRPLDEAAGVRQCPGSRLRRLQTVQAVLDGVRDILSERWAEDAALVASLREWLWAEALFRAS